MSWDGWINSLKGHDAVVEAAIYGKTGERWGSTPELSNVTVDQILALQVDKTDSLKQNGPMLGTKKCMFLRDERKDEHSLSMQLKVNKEGGGLNVCVGFTDQALVITMGPALSAGSLSQATFKAVKSLKDNGY